MTIIPIFMILYLYLYLYYVVANA